MLRHLGSARIPGTVMRILPLNDGSPKVTAYYEFWNFINPRAYIRSSSVPGRLCKAAVLPGQRIHRFVGRPEKRPFSAYFQYFRQAFDALNVQNFDFLRRNAHRFELFNILCKAVCDNNLGRIKRIDLIWRCWHTTVPLSICVYFHCNFSVRFLVKKDDPVGVETERTRQLLKKHSGTIMIF